METAYLETTFVSYLVALPARDLVIAAHQQITRDWWNRRRSDFRLVISQVVLDEISAGDESEARKRLDLVKSIEVLGGRGNLDGCDRRSRGSSGESGSRRGAHCRRNRPRCRISADMELQAFGQRADFAPRGTDLQRAWLCHADNLHSRGTVRGDR